MRLLFKSNAYKLSEKSTVCIDLTNLSRRIIRGKKWQPCTFTSTCASHLSDANKSRRSAVNGIFYNSDISGVDRLMELKKQTCKYYIVHL